MTTECPQSTTSSTMSSTNPFRHSPPDTTSKPLPVLPLRSPTSGPVIPGPSEPTIAEIVEDDLPPPYTPAPNVSLGEETIGLGPRRPFQQPPPIPSSSPRPSHPAQPIRPNPTSTSSHYTRPDPWQSQQQYRQRQTGGGGLIGALIDTVRDIADAVTSLHDERAMANAGAYAAPYGSHPGSAYAPPPGPPGQAYPSPPRRPSSTPPRARAVPDDGSPTRSPVPGHPLLREGHILVYPRDYLCDKCKNTGYKSYDPSHPCRKCWDKYARPYTGAITYTPWSSSGSNPRMQRPLPNLVPPHVAERGSGGLGTMNTPRPQRLVAPQHNRSLSQPHRVASPRGQSSTQGPSFYVVNPLTPWDRTPPVPHAVPVSPGDARLGGQLCWRCGGDGVRSFMLIDVVTCDQCNGTGRLWV